MKQYRHSIVVGGTGMLAQATLAVCKESKHTSVIARRASSFPAGDRINADYTDPDSFITALQEKMAEYGPPDLALLWMHSTGEESLLRLLDILAPQACTIVHVLGSASGDPRLQNGPIVQNLKALSLKDYYRTILGHKMGRWLTDTEISQGALDTLKAKHDIIVGEIERGYNVT